MKKYQISNCFSNCLRQNKYQNRNSYQRQNGLTLIEVILYVAIVSIVLTALIPFAWSMIGGSAKSASQQEVASQGRFLAERIQYEIRNANNITSVSATSIELNTDTNASTIIALSGGKVSIKYGAGAAVNLHSVDTNVTSLVFTNYTSADNKTKHIEFEFTIDDNFGSGRKEFDIPPLSFKGSAELRSN